MKAALLVSLVVVAAILPYVVESASLRDLLLEMEDRVMTRGRKPAGPSNNNNKPLPGPIPDDTDDTDTDDTDDTDTDDTEDTTEDSDDTTEDTDDTPDDASCGGLSSADLALFNSRDNVEAEVESDGSITVESDGIPDHSYGPFPSSGNPNSVSEQDFEFSFPQCPEKDTAGGSCLPPGEIGVAVNGVPIFNPFNINGEDAVLTEVMDDCNGHPDMLGIYHYHAIPTCLSTGAADELIGVAFDGYRILGPVNDKGVKLTSADLDECHGEVSDDGEYRYRITEDYPYILGCFAGTVSAELQAQQSRGNCYFAKRDYISMRSDFSRHREGRILKYRSMDAAKRQLEELLDTLDKTDF